jgi:HlyD family secretion protein
MHPLYRSSLRDRPACKAAARCGIEQPPPQPSPQRGREQEGFRAWPRLAAVINVFSAKAKPDDLLNIDFAGWAFAVWAFAAWAFAAWSVCSARPALAQPPGAPPSPVVVALAAKKEITPDQVFVGTVRPLKRAVIGSAVDGRVVEFNVEQGQRVEAMQPIAQLLTETIRLEVEAAEAELDLRKHEHEEMKNWTRPEELAQSRARVARTKALMDFAKQRYERLQSLAQAGGGLSQNELEESFSATVAAEENHRESLAANDLAEAGARDEKIAQAAAQVAIQTANVERLKDQLTKHTMISRFAGYVTAEHTEIGQWLKRGDPVAEVVALDEVDVEARLPEDYVAFVRPGSEATVIVPALPGQTLVGKVKRVVPQADERARTFPVLVRVTNIIGENDDPLLKAGMIARVALPTGAPHTALVVPKDAIVPGTKQIWVVDVDPKNPKVGKARLTPVEFGATSGSSIEVLKGLSLGDRVVVIGNERLRPGQEVAVTTRVEAAP